MKVLSLHNTNLLLLLTLLLSLLTAISLNLNVFYLFLVLIFIFLTIFIIIYPKLFLMFLGLFLLFQDLLIEIIGGRGTVYGEWLARAENFVLVLAFILIIFKRSISQQKLRLPFLSFVLAFTFVGFLANYLQQTPVYVALLGAYLLNKGYLIFILFANVNWKPSDFFKIKNYLFVIGLIFLAGAVIDFFAPHPFRSLIGNVSFIDYRAGLPSVQSFFIHPAVFGWFMSMLGFLFFSPYFITGKLKFNLRGLFFIFASFFSLRAKVIFSIIFAFLAGFFKTKSYKSIPFLIVSAFIIFALLGSITFQVIQNRYDIFITYGDPTKIARNALYVTSLKIASSYFPLGVGFGRFGSWASVLYYSPVYYQYNLVNIWGLSPNWPVFANDTFWPVILGETGVFGLILYVLILFKIVRAATKNSLKTHAERLITLAVLMIFVGALVETVADQSFMRMPQAYFVFGFLGFAYALKKKLNKAELEGSAINFNS